MPGFQIQKKAPSKINLFLRITGKRKDGYHEIETIFLPLDKPSDKITVKSSDNEGIFVSSSDANLPTGSSNICYRACLEYSKITNIAPNWEIFIEKNIPVAGGMAGGSTDAATVLSILQEKYHALGEDRLKEIAKKLGADVTFFLDPGPSLGLGIGENLEKVDLKDGLSIVIAVPLFPISAAWAYKHLSKNNNSNLPKLGELLKAMKTGDWEALGNSIYNELSTALYKKFPILTMIRNDLIKFGAINAEISGSGSTMFAICKNEHSANTLIAKMNNTYSTSIKCFKPSIYHTINE